MLDDDASSDEIFRIDEPERQWFSLGDLWSWLFPLIGLLAFKWVANPGISVAIACLKFGCADFRTAIWLGCDPVGQRGNVHACFYTARGCFVSSAYSFLCLILVALFERNQPFQALEDQLVWSTLVMLVGTLFGGLFGGWGLVLAVRYRQPMWMDPTIHHARKQRRWRSVCHGTRNGYPLLCIVILIVALCWSAGMIATCLRILVDPQRANEPLVTRVFASVIVFIILGSPAIAAIAAFPKAWRYRAPKPEFVWPP